LVARRETTEGLDAPKCGPQGQILAMRVATASFVVRWTPDGAWEDIGPSRGYYPSWTRDGRRFCSLVGPRVECYSFASRRFEAVAEPGDITPIPGMGGGRWLGLDLDDSPMIVRDVSTTDLYALD
jgi:hypothetical protein